MDSAAQSLSQPRRLKRSLGVIARVFLGGIFVWAGIQGLSTRSAHAKSSVLDKWLADSHERRIAFDVAECVLGAWIASGAREGAGLLVGILVLSAFTGVLAAELRSDLPRPCGCFEAAPITSDPVTAARHLREGILRNLGLTTIAATLYLFRKNK